MSKLLGGLNYDYRFRGDAPSPVKPVAAEIQNQAMNSLLNLIQAQNLTLPENLRYLIPPPPTEYARDRENFPTATGAPFDHLSPARAGADLVLRELLQAQRLTRLAEQHALDTNQPSPTQLLSGLMTVSWLAKPSSDPYQSAIQTEVNWLVLRHLMALASDSSTIDSTRALGLAQLVSLEDTLRSKAKKGDLQAIAAMQEIRAFLERKDSDPAMRNDPAPPGSPIG